MGRLGRAKEPLQVQEDIRESAAIPLFYIAHNESYSARVTKLGGNSA